MPRTRPITLVTRLENAAARGLIGASMLLPYRARVVSMGWLASRVLAPLLGWRRRIRENLDHVRPDLGPAERRAILREVPDNAGRAMIETYSAPEFIARNRDTPLEGPGLAPFLEARQAGRPVIVVSGHIGNYDALAVALAEAGHPMGVLYRPMQNPLFDAHYVRAISAFASELYSTDRAGVTRMVRAIRAGQVVGMNLDVNRKGGAPVSFMGKTALTATGPAEWALRYDALLLPGYGLRNPDGLTFRAFLDAPVAHGHPMAMIQALNDSLERQVRAHMGQWFWIHRRWRSAQRQRS